MSRLRRWVRRQWEIVTDPHGAAESDALVVSLKASAVKAGLRPGVERPAPGLVTVVEVTGVVLVVVSGALSLAGVDPRGWFA